MKDAAIAVMVVGVAYLIAVSFLTPQILERFGLPGAWAETGATTYGIFGCISFIGGVLWYLGWRANKAKDNE
ncbi:MAG: hypothetical protein AAF393_10080 [Pseudomonadota bacterium]